MPSPFHSTVRPLAHYLLAVPILAGYGGQVCPHVQTLPPVIWLLELIVGFVLFFILRHPILFAWVDASPPHFQPRRQAMVEFLMFGGWGIFLAGFNTLVYGFPLGENLQKLLLGTTALGFFAALDIGLFRSRWVSRKLIRRKTGFRMRAGFIPISLKIFTGAVGAMAYLFAVGFLILLQDFQALEAPAYTLAADTLIALGSAGLVWAVQVLNLVRSLTHYLKGALDRHHQALDQVARGGLSAHLTVSVNDEFGAMAQSFNIMTAHLRKGHVEAQQSQDAVILALAGLAETRMAENPGHVRRTQHFVRALAHQLSHQSRFSALLKTDTIRLYYRAAAIHDIGKAAIPDAILMKPGPLTAEEFDVMKQHTTFGAQVLARATRRHNDNQFLILAREMAYYHHERWDGTGYPKQLKGNHIPLAARVMCLADAYDTMVSGTVYQKAVSHATAKERIEAGRGSQFDPHVVDAFLAVEEQFITISQRFDDIAPVREPIPFPKPSPPDSQKKTP